MIDTTLTWSEVLSTCSPKHDVPQGVFRSVMGSFPTGVALVTTVNADGDPVGLTSTSVTSVSAEPPLLAVFVDKQSRTLSSLLSTQNFVVNFLREDCANLSTIFASKTEAKFANLMWSSTPVGIPELRRYSVATAECVEYETHDIGDHVMLTGRVVGGWVDSDGNPLTYFRQRYGRLLDSISSS